MNLVNALMGAIQNPNAQANPNQLGSIVKTVQQLSQVNQANPDMMQTALGIVGKYVRSGLQETANQQGGEAAAQKIVNQYSGTSPNAQVVNLLLSGSQVQQLVTEVTQKTGLPAGTIQALLPTLVPLVLQLLQGGTEKEKPNNSVLHSFLDSNDDGSIDLTDALKLASRYL